MADHSEEFEGRGWTLLPEVLDNAFLERLRADLQAAYAVKLGGPRKMTFLADIFNLFDERRITSYDQNTQLTYPASNPDFGQPVSSNVSGTPPQFQAPRNIRVGVRFEF